MLTRKQKTAKLLLLVTLVMLLALCAGSATVSANPNAIENLPDEQDFVPIDDSSSFWRGEGFATTEAVYSSLQGLNFRECNNIKKPARKLSQYNNRNIFSISGPNNSISVNENMQNDSIFQMLPLPTNDYYNNLPENCKFAPPDDERRLAHLLRMFSEPVYGEGNTNWQDFVPTFEIKFRENGPAFNTLAGGSFSFSNTWIVWKNSIKNPTTVATDGAKVLAGNKLALISDTGFRYNFFATDPDSEGFATKITIEVEMFIYLRESRRWTYTPIGLKVHELSNGLSAEPETILAQFAGTLYSPARDQQGVFLDSLPDYGKYAKLTGWCHLPPELYKYCDEPLNLLPMWRWTSATYVWTDWGGEGGLFGWLTSGVRSIGGAALDLLVRFSFILAGLLWRLLAGLLDLALDADFTDSLLKSMDRIFYSAGNSLIDSGLVFLVALIALLAALRQMHKSGFQEAVRVMVWSIAPIGLLLSMWLAVNRVYSDDSLVNNQGLEYQTTEEDTLTPSWFGTPSWMYSKLRTTTAYLSESLVRMSFGLTDGRSKYNSYCSVYAHQLEKLYLQTKYSKGVGVPPSSSDYPSIDYPYQPDFQLPPSAYSFIAISRLWERAYLSGWSYAQFGSPQRAQNGSCLWAEANTANTPVETMAIWGTTCNPNDFLPDAAAGWEYYGAESSTMLYGCEDTLMQGGVALPEPTPLTATRPSRYDQQQKSRAWRIFKPPGGAMTRVFLNLASGCGLVSANAPDLGKTPDGVPGVYNDRRYADAQNKVYRWVQSDHDTLILLEQSPGLYLPQHVAGIARNHRSNTGNADLENFKWTNAGNWPFMTAITCGAWVTGATEGLDCPGCSGVFQSKATWNSAAVDDRVIGFSMFGDGSRSRAGASHEHAGFYDRRVAETSAYDCGDITKSALKFTTSNPGTQNDTQTGDLQEITDASVANRLAADVCITEGASFGFRLLHAIITLATAIIFFMSLLGLSAGTALAQIILGMIFMMLPLILIISAIPSRATKTLALRVLKIAVGASLAHAIFLLLLTIVVLLVDVMVYAISESTEPGWTRAMFLAIIPVVVLKMVSGLTKQFGFNATGLKGALSLTSGLAAGNIGNSGGGGGSTIQRYGRGMVNQAVGPYAVRRAFRGGSMSPRAAGAAGRGGAAAAGGLKRMLNPLRPSSSQKAAAASGSKPAGAVAKMRASLPSTRKPAEQTKPASAGGAMPSVVAPGASDKSAQADVARQQTASVSPRQQSEAATQRSQPQPVAQAQQQDASIDTDSSEAHARSAQYATSPREQQPQEETGLLATAPPEHEPAPQKDLLKPRKLDKTRVVAGFYAKKAARFVARHPLASMAAFSAATMGIGLPAAMLLYGTSKVAALATRIPRRIIKNKAQSAWQGARQSRSELQGLLTERQALKLALMPPLPPEQPPPTGTGGGARQGGPSPAGGVAPQGYPSEAGGAPQQAPQTQPRTQSTTQTTQPTIDTGAYEPSVDMSDAAPHTTSRPRGTHGPMPQHQNFDDGTAPFPVEPEAQEPQGPPEWYETTEGVFVPVDDVPPEATLKNDVRWVQTSDGNLQPADDVSASKQNEIVRQEEAELRAQTETQAQVQAQQQAAQPVTPPAPVASPAAAEVSAPAPLPRPQPQTPRRRTPQTRPSVKDRVQPLKQRFNLQNRSIQVPPALQPRQAAQQARKSAIRIHNRIRPPRAGN